MPKEDSPGPKVIHNNTRANHHVGTIRQADIMSLSKPRPTWTPAGAT